MSTFQKTVLALLGLVAVVVIAAVGVAGWVIVSQNRPPPTITPTPGPSPTPAPTATPAPTPTPIIYRWEGEGDDVIFFDVPQAGPGIMNASYAGDGNFIVTLYRADGEYIDLLVNTVDKYDGKTTYRAQQPGKYYLQIEASGYDYKANWVIVMAPPQ